MEPFDSIEKWINEHGSAAVLRDHVALLKGQMAIKDDKLKELELLLKKTEAERDDLRKKLELTDKSDDPSIYPV